MSVLFKTVLLSLFCLFAWAPAVAQEGAESLLPITERPLAPAFDRQPARIEKGAKAASTKVKAKTAKGASKALKKASSKGGAKVGKKAISKAAKPGKKKRK